MKKIISVILVMIMLTTTAFAVSRTFEKLDTKKLNIVIDGGVSAKEALAGKEVAVSIRLVNNKAISSLKLALTYDKNLSVVTTKNKKGEDTPKITLDIYDPEDGSAQRSTKLNAETRTLNINWVSSEEEVRGDCVYATIIFKVSDKAKAGDFLPVTVSSIDPENVFDINQKNIDFKIINGGIDVVSYIKGDVDGDGALSNRDIMMLSAYIGGTTPKGFVTAAADYNEDKSTNKKDLTALFAAVCEYTYALPDVDKDNPDMPDSKLGIVIDGAESAQRAVIGKNVDVKISLVNNPGISSIKSVVYWSDEMKLVDAKYDIYDKNDTSAMINTVSDWSKVEDSFAFNWVSGKKEVKDDVTFVTLTFNIPENIKDGKFLYVAMTADNIFNAAGNEISFVLLNGGVKTKSVTLGDPTDDGNIDNKDVVALFRYVSGSSTEDDIVVEAADFNEDGEVNNKDVVALFRFVSSAV